MKTKTITAKNLATGDLVKFPRVGLLTVKRLYSKFDTSISAIFSDGKMRTLKADRQLSVELSQAQPVAGKDELYRKDLETSRVSLISRSAFRFGFEDVSGSFKALRGRVQSMNEVAALSQIDLGSTLYTEKAIYYSGK